MKGCSWWRGVMEIQKLLHGKLCMRRLARRADSLSSHLLKLSRNRSSASGGSDSPSTAVWFGSLAAFVEIAHVTDSVGGNHLGDKNCDCKGLIHSARRNAVFVFLGLF